METMRQANRSADERFAIVRWLNFVSPEGGRRLADGEYWVHREGRWATESEWAAEEKARKLAESPEVVRTVERLMEDGARQSRVYDHTPTWSDIKREFPKLDVIENEDGTKTADFHDETLDLRDKKRLNEMLGEAREVEIEKSEVLSSRVETVTVGKGRHKRTVPLKGAEKVDRALHGRD